VWTNNDTGASSDSTFDRADALSVRMSNHAHDGTPGGGALISAGNLDDFNNLFGVVQRVTPASGVYGNDTTDDYSAFFDGKVPTGSPSTVGVFAVGSFPENVVRIRSNDRPVTNSGGLEIYGRFDVAGSGPYVWNVDYYVQDVSLGETSETLPTIDTSSTRLDLYFMEVFTAGTRPTVPQTLTNLIPLGGTGGGGGGGGSSIEWNTDSPNAVTIKTEHGQRIASFESTDQYLYGAVIVPPGYSGTPIKVTCAHYTNATGSQLINAYVRLISTGQPINSTTFTRTTTNSAVTVTDPLEVAYSELDISDTDGDIGGISASPGETILIRLQRDVDTSAQPVNVLISTLGVSFS
jgi:hypothetical protein